MILENFILTDAALQSKAPQGMMYDVDSIHFVNVTAEAGTFLYVGDFNVHPTRTQDNRTPRNWLAIHECDSIHSSQIRDINEKTKFLILIKDSDTPIGARVTVYGKLVKASRTQLLIEWFRKVR